MLRLIIVIFCILCSYQIICERDSGESDFEKSALFELPGEASLENIYQRINQASLILENQRFSNERLSIKLDIIEELLEQQGLSTSAKINNTFQAESLYRPKSCEEALLLHKANEGVFQISVPESGLDPFFVSCIRHPETDDAWMVVQRRMDGKFKFHQNWHDYKNGFGDIFREYWLGLERLHALTNSRRYKLWIELKDFAGDRRSAYYTLFAIGNESTKYALNILGVFSGDAGDSLRYHAGHKFSTYDNPNGINMGCASHGKGAWWFKVCQDSELNGEYYAEGMHKNVGKGLGISWNSWLGNRHSLKYAHMAIRPIDD